MVSLPRSMVVYDQRVGIRRSHGRSRRACPTLVCLIRRFPPDGARPFVHRSSQRSIMRSVRMGGSIAHPEPSAQAANSRATIRGMGTSTGRHDRVCSRYVTHSRTQNPIGCPSMKAKACSKIGGKFASSSTRRIHSARRRTGGEKDNGKF